MENILPKYQRPITKIDDPTVNVDYWDEATEAFDDKNFKQSAIAVINYINPNILKNINTEQEVVFNQMQGSAEIKVKITDSTFCIKAPFLRITDQTNQVALLRRVAEVNFTPLRLAQIHLKENELFFEYEMPIELAQPNKVYDILREVCVYADDFDDKFIEKYKADFYKTPKKTVLSDEEKDLVWQQITDIFEDYRNYSAFFKEKRWDGFIWDLLSISFLKISNMPYIHGKLRSDLISNISSLFNFDADFNYRIDKGVNFMKDLMARSKEDILSNAYHADQFLSLRWRSSEQIIKDWAQNRLETIQKYEKEESYFNMSYYLQVAFLKLIYDYNLEQNYVDAINNVLEEVSGLEPSDAAPKLGKVYYQLLNGEINQAKPEAEEKKGFFSKLFN